MDRVPEDAAAADHPQGGPTGSDHKLREWRMQTTQDLSLWQPLEVRSGRGQCLEVK